jgi:hypothetical protein
VHASPLFVLPLVAVLLSGCSDDPETVALPVFDPAPFCALAELPRDTAPARATLRAEAQKAMESMTGVIPKQPRPAREAAEGALRATSQIVAFATQQDEVASLSLPPELRPTSGPLSSSGLMLEEAIAELRRACLPR